MFQTELHRKAQTNFYSIFNLVFNQKKMYIDPVQSVHSKIFFRLLWSWKMFIYHILIFMYM